MHSSEEEGYIRETKKLIDAQVNVCKATKHIPTLYIYGEPRASVVAFNSKSTSTTLTTRRRNVNGIS
jgi:hypothetical protein